MRWLLRVETAAVVLAGIPLFLGTEETDKYFAWTIKPPITAAFLGSLYWSAAVLDYLSSRERLWANARLAVPAVFVFSVLGLAATLLHIDRFHLDSPIFVARAVAWAWLAIYVLVPAATLLLLVPQMRVDGADPPRSHVLPGWFRVTLAVQAAALLVSGAGLFTLSQTVTSFWPWELTPLTARIGGAWLVGLGTAAAHAAWEGDRDRIRIGLVTYAIAAILVCVALVRYSDAVHWASPGGVAFVVFVTGVLLVATAGLTMRGGQDGAG